MKTILIYFIMFYAMPSFAQSEPIRCKEMTRWGQCTNEALKDTLCVIHWPPRVKEEDDIKPKASGFYTTPAKQTSGTTTITTKKKASTSTKVTTVRRCAARTQKGTQCSRNASPGSSYCWQHSR